MLPETAEVAPPLSSDDPSLLSAWRALWALEDGQLAWLRESVATLDAYAQGQMGHS